MLLVIDNYDSFTYNLVQYLGEAGAELHVIKNDEMSITQIAEKFTPTHLMISPGPGTPNDAGVSLDAIRHYAGGLPILGVCLGHQAIGQYFGATVGRAPEPVHGKAVTVSHSENGIFEGIPNPFSAGRYHSLVVDRESVPDELEITAESPDGLVMGLRHREMEIHGVQFHPESILTEHGKRMLQNFIGL